MHESDKTKKIVLCVIGAFTFFLFFCLLFLSAPADFPAGGVFKVEPGMSLRSVSLSLLEKHMIRSRLAFEAFVIMFGTDDRVISSDYYFEDRLPVYIVAKRIARGEHRIAPVSVTIPEGFDTSQIAETFASELANFSKNEFLLEAKPKEGYLFPDTYFFLITDDEKDVLKSMSENFEKKITPIRPEILAAKKTEKEIIIMASIIEREAKGEIRGKSDRGFISGILWKRLAIGIPLQVDAAPETYKTKGLPKKPISNPGLEAIEAAIHPQSSPYLYYLHDKSGNIHYARTFGEHINNKFKYLQ